jgi:tRNA (cmo5U34)-methyltransferase
MKRPLPKEEKKDTIFAAPNGKMSDFRFDETVAQVFDDMVSRSVPFYREIQRMVCELSHDFARANTNLYDIGCATATTLLTMDKVLDPTIRFVGIDNSEEMLSQARKKVDSDKTKRAIEFVCADIEKGFSVENASVIIMILTLQFVRPLYRERVMKTIYQGLNDQGCLILIEKLTNGDTIFNRLFISHYYDFKRRNGYSEIEISQKREALENVLIPYRMQENIELLQGVGFRHSEVFFRWYNFCGLIAVK